MKARSPERRPPGGASASPTAGAASRKDTAAAKKLQGAAAKAKIRAVLTQGVLGVPQDPLDPVDSCPSMTPWIPSIWGKCHRKRSCASARTFGSAASPAAAHWVIAPGESDADIFSTTIQPPYSLLKTGSSPQATMAGRFGGQSKAALLAMAQQKQTVRAGWLSDLSTLSVFHIKSTLYGAFVWSHGALNRPFRRFPARAGDEGGAGGCGASRRKGRRVTRHMGRNLIPTGSAQNLGQLQGSYRDSQSNCWANS
jgi:hypothetical protein